jgi:hypothetical protein
MFAGIIWQLQKLGIPTAVARLVAQYGSVEQLPLPRLANEASRATLALYKNYTFPVGLQIGTRDASRSMADANNLLLKLSLFSRTVDQGIIVDRMQYDVRQLGFHVRTRNQKAARTRQLIELLFVTIYRRGYNSKASLFICRAWFIFDDDSFFAHEAAPLFVKNHDVQLSFYLLPLEAAYQIVRDSQSVHCWGRFLCLVQNNFILCVLPRGYLPPQCLHVQMNQFIEGDRDLCKGTHYLSFDCGAQLQLVQ